jgi:hypothetical protein
MFSSVKRGLNLDLNETGSSCHQICGIAESIKHIGPYLYLSLRLPDQPYKKTG